jgi:hypothetical protein
MREILERQGRLMDIEPWQELNLDVSTEELLSAERAFTYADLYGLLGNHTMFGNRKTVAWLTPHAAVVSEYGRERVRAYLLSFCLPKYFRCSIIVDGKAIHALASSVWELSHIVGFFSRLLLVDVSGVHKLELRYRGQHCMEPLIFVNVPSLAHLMERCQNLNVLILQQTVLDEADIRVLGNLSKPGFKLELRQCRITSAAALARVLGRNQGPTKLDSCDIDNSVLTDGLRGNSRLKSFRPHLSNYGDGARKEEVLALAGALKENKGLIDLDFRGCDGMSEEIWCTICDALKAHPTLQVLSLPQSKHRDGEHASSLAGLESRIQVLVKMLKVSMTIHTIRLHHYYNQHELFRGSVVPYLEMNRLRPRVLAIQRTRPIAYRAKILGRALLASRTSANSFWILLSGNSEVIFPSATATTMPAANLPSPGPVAAIATVTVTATRATSTTVASPTTYVASNAVYQKGNARP